MIPRLVATDLDGTIVRRDGTISRRTVTALRDIQSAGAMVVFASGRPPRWLYPVVEETGIEGPTVCSNGAQIYDTTTNTVLKEHTLHGQIATEIASDLRLKFDDAVFAAEIGLGFGHEPKFAPGWDPPADSIVASVADLLINPVVKLMARCPSADPDELLFIARQLVAERASVTRSIGISLVEISKRGTDKGTALAELAAANEIDSSQVVAFGDQSNDSSMLMWAGRSIAVGNAHQDAVSAAGEVTASVQDDGVALVLEEIIRKG
ncbi:MAG TPA: HAD family hydrolase [Acidimicrobiales bacterium]|nr:HAD family hydrolase [Acidimicrobiales bacterium]